VKYKLLFTKRAAEDALKLKSCGLEQNAMELFEVLANNPYKNPPPNPPPNLPPFEKLVGDLSGFYSRRINIKHRLVYQIFESEKTVKVIRMWSHYE